MCVCIHTYIHIYIYQAKIDTLSEACAPPIKELLDVHGDVVTLRGMPYLGDLSAPLNDVLDRVEGKVRR